jgi:ferric-dicitrate binding protein FerR (iron transport regulator)
MDERNRTTEPQDEQEVRRLLEMAGPRPEIPEKDLRQIAAAARVAWREQAGRTAAGPSIPNPVGSARRWRVQALAAGLAAVLAIALGLAWWRSGSGDGVPPTVALVESVSGPVELAAEARGIAPGEAVPLGAELRSADGRASLRLAGGANVRLDVETRVRFISASALELESGALYVDTGSRTPPIEVRTPLGTVRDVGTRFSVRVAGDLAVRVREGSVLTERQGRTYLARAGQELVLRRDGRTERREAASHGPGWEWVLAASPGFDVEGRSLRELLDWVAGETGWRIVFADEGLADSADGIVLHGSLGGLRPDQAPFALLPGAGLSGELEDGTLIVRRPSRR